MMSRQQAPISRRAFLAMMMVAVAGATRWRTRAPDDGATSFVGYRTSSPAAPWPLLIDTGHPPPRPRQAVDVEHPHVAEESGSTADGAPSTSASDAISVSVICREALGLVDARVDERRHDLQRLTLHHTAVRLDRAALAPARLRGHQAFHLDQGWSDIAYHFGVDPLGNVYELRDPQVPGDTFTGYDPSGHLLIVAEGDFSVEEPTDTMIESLAQVVAWAAERYQIPVTSLSGHRDHTATACPGDALYRRLPVITARAAQILDTMSVTAHRLCGPEAQATVAGIAAG